VAAAPVLPSCLQSPLAATTQEVTEDKLHSSGILDPLVGWIVATKLEWAAEKSGDGAVSSMDSADYYLPHPADASTHTLEMNTAARWWTNAIPGLSGSFGYYTMDPDFIKITPWALLNVV